VKVSWNLIV